MRGTWLEPWPTLPPDALLRPAVPRAALPFPLAEEHCRLFAVARHGLWHGLRTLGIAPGDALLAPAYHHGSEIEVLVRLGAEVRFYGSLVPDPDELASLVDERVRALHLIHYLGFPQDAARWRTWCDAHGLLLIEDCAQAWLASRDGVPVGSYGDVAIWSLYKTFGLPDGAALRCRLPVDLSGSATETRHGWGESAQLALAWLAQRLPLHTRQDGAADATGYDPAEDFALGDPASAPSAMSMELLPRVADAGAAAARRANYRVLLEALGDHVASPFASLPDGASPWMFPLEVSAKAALRDRLAFDGVGTLDIWRVPHPSLPVERFPEAALRRECTIGLPVHQELQPEHLERIIQAMAPRARRRQSLSVEPADLFDWSGLADNPFLTPAWSAAWWRHLGAGELRVRVCRRPGGEVAAVLPLCVGREGALRVARWVGHGPGDQLGPVCAPRDREGVARALRRALPELCADVLVADGMPADEGWAALLGGFVLERDAGPVFDFDGLDWEAWLASRSQNFRQQVRRRERALFRDHEVEYRLCDDPARLAEDLDELIRLHELRWAGASDAFAGERRAFHHDVAARALGEGWLRLWQLRLDGGVAAAWYGFRRGGAEWFYQLGRDASAGDNVGFVLLAHTIREAMADGMSAYRFLLGDEPYKARFANRDPGLERVAVAISPAGHAWLAAQRARPLAGHLLRRLRLR
jgi:dTDP-4-amino-4,6-dideoxygalactose transaminase/CelD/BcsL family acetyltransferase involved in cellulose biosynthesis